jgi:urease gamma subunit
MNAMAADLARVRRERDTIQQKLDAIADIEKTLMERDGDATSPPDGTLP